MEDQQTTTETLGEAVPSEPSPRKSWHAPKFMMSNISGSADTSANNTDHNGGSIS